MQAHWSREDLPHWDVIRDADDMHGNGMRSRVIDIALDTVVEHLNEHHPRNADLAVKVRQVEAQRDTQKTKARRARRARDKWQAACETATANATMWMDQAVAHREFADETEKANDALRARLAEAEKQRDDAHRVYEKVRGECDSWMTSNNNWKSRYDSAEQARAAAGRELAQANDELGRLQDAIGEWSTDAVRQQMQGWDRLASHPFFRDCYQADGSLIDAMIAKLDWALSETAVTCDIVDEPDPVEDKAQELYGAARPVTAVTWGDLVKEAKEPYRRMARHVLGVDDE